MSKVIVITGSTKGIGYGIAEEFLKAGCKVVLSGRNAETLAQATGQLAARYGNESSAGFLCDVTVSEQVQKLWDSAVAKFGCVDIWINNAGTAHTVTNLWELDEKLIQAIIDSNIIGLLNGCRVAIQGMLSQGGGQIYNFEGFGSSGRVQKGLGVYGASKAAVAFLNKTFAAELEGTKVKIGSVQPGMVKTGLVLDQFKDDAEGLEKFKPIFNIIASKVDEVAPVIARRMLDDNKNGTHIEFLSRAGMMMRFLTAPFAKRDLFKD
ncbi:MAG: SDR family oxidoreductase [Chloroflexota bacterium]